MFAFLSFVFLSGGIVEVGMWLIEVAALSGVDGVTPEAVFCFYFPHHPGTLFPLSLRIKSDR